MARLANATAFSAIAHGVLWCVCINMASGDEAFFESKIRPVLVKHCYECHSDKSKKLGGNLRLDTREGMIQGGESGPVLVPGKPEESLIVRALKHDSIEMPPDNPLPEAIIHDFSKWIESGATDPRTGAPTTVTNKSVEREKLWSFLPRTKPTLPEVLNQAWVRDPLDAFVLANIERAQLEPASDVEPSSLARRLYFDLIGLPPSSREIKAFEFDYAQHGSIAVAELVDQLLSNEQFGVRWGRHWLDVARYGESNGDDGLGRNASFPNAWRYRDYVIQSLNADIPFNQFIVEQVAGDMLPASTASERNRLLTATGFLAIGPKPAVAMNNNFAMDVVDDQINTVCSAVLGLSVACARCHDHKHDPISSRDYYALAGIFSSTETLWGAAGNEKLTAPPTPLHELYDVLPEVDPLKIDRSKAPVFTENYAATVKELQPLVYAPLDQATDAFIYSTEAEYSNTEYARVKNFQGVGQLNEPTTHYSVSLWFKNVLKNDARPITAYLFSHALMGEPKILGDHLGIGGNFEHDRIGKLFVFNGNTDKKKTISGTTIIPPETWNHVTFVRDGKNVRVYLNGKLEIQDELEPNFGEQLDYCFGSRSDKFAPLEGNLSQCCLFERALSEEEVHRIQVASDQPFGIELPRPIGFAMGVRDKRKMVNCKIHVNGDVSKLGPEVARGFLSSYEQLGNPDSEHFCKTSFNEQHSGRMQLAQWLTHPAHPQTARVLVNRVWLKLMGQGIVATPDDFGVYGARPSHPELLDYLANQFIDEGWSVKQLIRHIVLSHAYQLDSRSNDRLLREDPDNQLFARHTRRRMDAEEVRDSILFVCGGMELSPGQGSAIGEKNLLINWPIGSAVSFHQPSQHRSVYLCFLRHSPPPELAAFDLPDGISVTGQRDVTSLPNQPLFLLNSSFVVDQSLRLADQILANERSDAERIGLVYEQVLHRHASTTEVERSSAYLQRMDELLKPDVTDPERRRQRAWASLCQALFTTNEFLFID